MTIKFTMPEGKKLREAINDFHGEFVSTGTNAELAMTVRPGPIGLQQISVLDLIDLLVRNNIDFTFSKKS